MVHPPPGPRRNVDLGIRLVGECLTISDVGNNAHNGVPRVWDDGQAGDRPTRRGEPKATPERALAGKEHSFGRLVERDDWFASRVGVLERTTAEHRNSEGFEILRRHRSK